MLDCKVCETEVLLNFLFVFYSVCAALIMSTSNKKRKVELDNRKFNERWENEFLFTDFGSKPQCLVCLQVVSVMKEYNIRRHYESTHKVKFGSVSGEARLSLVRELKSKMQKQKNTFFKATRAEIQSTGVLRGLCDNG